MPSKPPYKPEHASTLAPYLCVDGAAKAIDFYKDVFGATVKFRMDRGPKVGHAELAFGEAFLMIADEFPDVGFFAPKAGANVPVQMLLYVPDVDATTRKAVERGAKVLQPPTDQFYGDRSCKMTDPFGHVWQVSTHIEDVSPEELKRRTEKFAKVG